MASRRIHPTALLASLLTLGLVVQIARVLSQIGTSPTPARVELSQDDLRAGQLTKAAFLRQGADGRQIYASAIGPVAFRKAFVKHGPPKGRRALGRAIERADRAGLAASAGREGWFWRPFAPLGGYLVDASENYWVLPEAVLERRAVPAQDKAGARRALIGAIEQYVAALSESGDLSPWMAGALREFVGRLDDDPADPSSAELDSDFARRVASTNGWLARIAPGVALRARATLEQALADSLALAPQLHVEGEGRSLTIFGNVWGMAGSLYRSPNRALLLRVPPHPMDGPQRAEALDRCRLGYELPAGADPISDPAVVAALESAVFFEGDTVLATWSHAAGFTSDDDAWRRRFPPQEGESLPGAFPPHIPIAGPDGVLHGLALAGGVLRPVRNDPDAEAERFLEDAARLLPDAPHLDLLQQYFLRYTWDSPEVTEPLMIGSPAYSGDIHQTVAQILDTCAGGICRGDCDDVAEFIQAVALRQGKLAHVVNLPEHLATMWAEKRDGTWHVFVLQSGPTMAFQDAALPKALEMAYLGLDANAPFDRNAVSVSLRFGDQNTRANHELSWRIFEDPAYAAVMLDVQADWNVMTLLRAEQKMLRLIASGDETGGNYNELAGLYSWTSRHDKAIEYARLALKRRSEPESRLLMSAQLVGHLLAAGERAEAEAMLADILQKQLPAFAPEGGLRALGVAVGLGSSLSVDAPQLAAKVLVRASRLRTNVLGTSTLAELLAPDRPVDAWRDHAQNEALQNLMVDYVWAALDLLPRVEAGTRARDENVRAMTELLDAWLQRYAFDDVEEPESIPDRWTLRARRLAVDAGAQFLARLETAEPPASLDGLQEILLATDTPDETTLSWTRASPWYAAYALADLSADEKKHPDPGLVRRLALLLDQAEAAAADLGLHGPDTEAELREARIRIALLTQNEGSLRTLLRGVREIDDRYLYESVSAAIGWAAVHVDLPWWRTVLRCWADEVDNRVSYFNIVWCAIAVGAKAHALHAAEVAAKRFPDDAAIQEETRLLRAFLAK